MVLGGETGAGVAVNGFKIQDLYDEDPKDHDEESDISQIEDCEEEEKKTEAKPPFGCKIVSIYS